MGLINCSKLLRVGVQQLDDQHCGLVEIINQLHGAIKEGQGNQAILTALQQLQAYTESHFKFEEELLELHQYPQLEEHRCTHLKLVEQLTAFQQELETSPASIQHHLLQFLMDWLTSHIKNVDREYGNFLNNRGVY